MKRFGLYRLSALALLIALARCAAFTTESPSSPVPPTPPAESATSSPEKPVFESEAATEVEAASSEPSTLATPLSPSSSQPSLSAEAQSEGRAEGVSEEPSPEESAPAAKTPSEEPSEKPSLPKFERPSYMKALIHGRDLVLNRQYEEARVYFSEYGASHSEDPIGAFGLALVAVMERTELRDFRDSSELDAVFDTAREAAAAWRKEVGKEGFPTLLLGAAEAMQALWWLKTDSKLKGVPRAISAVDHIEDATRAAPPSLDAVGALGMYYYLKGRYGSRYLFFVPDTRDKGRIATERCAAGEAPVLAPLCRLFLLYVYKWEGRWEQLNEQAGAFSARYPRSMFAPVVQAEGQLINKNSAGALATLLRAEQHSSDSAMLYYWLGRTYWDGLKLPVPAKEAWERALKLGLYDAKRQADAHAGLGEIALLEGDLGTARFRFDWALRLDGDSLRAKGGRVRLLQALQQKNR